MSSDFEGVVNTGNSYVPVEAGRLNPQNAIAGGRIQAEGSPVVIDAYPTYFQEP